MLLKPSAKDLRKYFFVFREIFIVFLSTDRQMVEIQGNPPAEPVGGSVPAFPIVTD